MPLKIVRNDITKMKTEAIVNTANDYPTVGTGCDSAVYKAAGYDELLAYRTEHIGYAPEGSVFITPGFNLHAKYIIHAVSPHYVDGNEGEEEKLRACYRNSLKIAKENKIHSVSFPLISTGGFGYPKEKGMRIAIDEINAFLLDNDMDITLVVFDSKAVRLGLNVYPDLEAFIDQNYVEEKREEEYGDRYYGSARPSAPGFKEYAKEREAIDRNLLGKSNIRRALHADMMSSSIGFVEDEYSHLADTIYDDSPINSTLDERLMHAGDPFGRYLLYMIKEKGMSNSEVYKRALISKQSFGKLNKDPDRYHPDKVTALQYCVGAKLNLDETKDMLARAGYALSPADKRDIIFEYFISHEVFDMIDIDIALEEHDIPCIIK